MQQTGRISAEIKCGCDRVTVPSARVSLCPAQFSPYMLQRHGNVKSTDTLISSVDTHGHTQRQAPASFSISLEFLSQIATVISLPSNFYYPLDFFPPSTPSFP